MSVLQTTACVRACVCVREITSQLLLPVHLIEEVFGTQKEVVNLAALLVSFCSVVDTQLGLLGEKLADVGHGKDYLLHGAIQPHNLDTIRDAAKM